MVTSGGVSLNHAINRQEFLAATGALGNLIHHRKCQSEQSMESFCGIVLVYSLAVYLEPLRKPGSTDHNHIASDEP